MQDPIKCNLCDPRTHDMMRWWWLWWSGERAQVEECVFGCLLWVQINSHQKLKCLFNGRMTVRGGSQFPKTWQLINLPFCHLSVDEMFPLTLVQVKKGIIPYIGYRDIAGVSGNDFWIFENGNGSAYSQLLGTGTGMKNSIPNFREREWE